VPLQQLYYTSCRVGLSGFTGWQFNAVSAGVGTDLTRDVEALTAYQPPQSMMYSDAPEDLARCPVNLCWVPGSSPIALCVRYTGRDDSRRFGNYFAHALCGSELDLGALPVELWRSPVWRHEAIAGTELPELDGPPPAGPLTPGAADAFVAAHPHGGQLFRLAAAVVAALDTDRGVVVVERDTDAVAHWIAAVCYLLPPEVARSVSFATFPKRPERSRLRVVGTLPEVWRETDPDAEVAGRVFDFTTGRFPEVAAPPPVALLARIGLPAARTFWEWAREYTTGEERTLDAWYPAAVAAAASGGTALEPGDAAVLVEWLDRSAGHLDPATRASVARDAYRHRPLDPAQLRALREVARATGDTALAELIQGDLLERDLRGYLAGDPTVPEPRPITDPALREQATRAWLTLFAGAGTEPAVRLLRWAAAGGLRPDREALLTGCAGIGRELLARTVTAPLDEAFQDRLRDAAADWPELREGVVEALRGQFASHPHHFPQLLSQLPNGLIGEADLADEPLLRVEFLLARVERRPGTEAECLGAVLRVLGPTAPLDDALLRRLWRASWTQAQAMEVIRALEGSRPVDVSAIVWFDRAVRAAPDDPADPLPAVELARALLVPARRTWLGADGRECAAALVDLAESLEAAKDATGIARALAARPNPSQLWLSYRALRDWAQPRAMARCHALPGDLAAFYARMGDTPRWRYLALEHRTLLDGRSPHRLAHLGGLVLAARWGSRREQERITAILRELSDRLHPESLWKLADLAAENSAPDARWLTELARERSLSRWQRTRRSAGRFLPRGRRGEGRGGEGRERRQDHPAGQLPAPQRDPYHQERRPDRPDRPPEPRPDRQSPPAPQHDPYQDRHPEGD
jgi:hypothetical protein